MDIVRAKEIISALAEGVDLGSSEILTDTSVCNKGEIVRALYTILNTLDISKPKKELPAKTGKPWTKEDDQLLVNLYHSDTPKEDICNTLQRSPSGVAARLVRLGVISNRDTFRRRT